MIDVLLPVLGRPESAPRVIASILENSKHVSRILFLCSEGDTDEIEACRSTGADVLVTEIVGGHQYPMKMNAGFRETTSDYVFLGADDLDFQPRWDTHALEVALAGAGVIATNDLANPEVKKGIFGTHCLVRRSYVEEQGASLDGPGWLLSEAYDHNFVDRELCHLAEHRGLYAFAEHSHVVHKHPHWKTAPMDSTYEKGLANFREDRRLFLRRITAMT